MPFKTETKQSEDKPGQDEIKKAGLKNRLIGCLVQKFIIWNIRGPAESVKQNKKITLRCLPQTQSNRDKCCAMKAENSTGVRRQHIQYVHTSCIHRLPVNISGNELSLFITHIYIYKHMHTCTLSTVNSTFFDPYSAQAYSHTYTSVRSTTQTAVCLSKAVLKPLTPSHHR